MSQLSRLTEHIVSAEVSISVPVGCDIEQLRLELYKLGLPCETDIILQVDDIKREKKRLVVFDMDSTLIQ